MDKKMQTSGKLLGESGGHEGERPVVTRGKVQQLLSEVSAQLAEKTKNGNPGSSNIITLSLASTESELKEAATVVTLAFMDYRLFVWMMEGITDIKRREAIVRFLSTFVQRLCLLTGFVILARNEQGQIMGVAQIAHENPVRSRLRTILAKLRVGLVLLFHLLFGSIGFPWFFFQSSPRTFLKRAKTTQVLQVEHNTAIDELKLSSPYSDEHLYLIQIATDPRSQANGFGTALLTGLGAISDHYDLPVYLETDELRLRGFYERNGFQVKRDYVVDDGTSKFTPNFGMIRLPSKRNT